MDDSKIKHLEMVQNVVTRMAGNSFALKGWTVALIAGILALSAKETNTSFFIIAYVPILVFWFLDSYYLQLERKYRILYNRIVKGTHAVEAFSMEIVDSCKTDKTLFCQALFSDTESLFYLPTAFLVLIVILFL